MSSGASWPSARGARVSDAFRVLDARVSEERAEWLRLWQDWPSREVHAHPAYALLFASESDAVLCATYSSGEEHVMYPFSLRAIDLPTAAGAKDIVSPYGYGGAFAWSGGGERAPEPAAGFWAAFDSWAASRGIVTEFIRFSLFPENLLAYPGLLEERLTNIVVSLGPSEDEIWMSFESKVRKNVKKAQRVGVHIETDRSGERLDDFLEIYHGTLDRRDAAEGYYWPREFFESIIAELAGSFMFFHALAEGRVVSTELVLVSSESVYSFLGGTRGGDFELRPNDLLKYEVIRWAKSQGKAHFVLGGGAAAGDGIERYKRSFAPHGLVPFFTGQRVLDESAYARLTAASRDVVLASGGEWDSESQYFPRYRKPS